MDGPCPEIQPSSAPSTLSRSAWRLIWLDCWSKGRYIQVNKRKNTENLPSKSPQSYKQSRVFYITIWQGRNLTSKQSRWINRNTGQRDTYLFLLLPISRHDNRCFLKKKICAYTLHMDIGVHRDVLIWFLPLSRSCYSAVLPAAEGTEVYPLCQRPAQRPEASQHIYQHGPTAAQDRRLRAGQNSRPSLFS